MRLSSWGEKMFDRKGEYGICEVRLCCEIKFCCEIMLFCAICKAFIVFTAYCSF